MQKLEVSRYVIKHKHTPTESPKTPKSRSKTDPRVARVKYLFGQIRLLEKKAASAEAEVRDHPLQEELIGAREELEWESAMLAQQDRACRQYQVTIEACDEAIEVAKQTIRDANRRKAALQALLNHKVAERTLALNRSMQPGGAIHREKALCKLLTSQTKRIAKHGREAHKKADKLRSRLTSLLEELRLQGVEFADER